jgi:TRAP transporter TAXI family solute receptor
VDRRLRRDARLEPRLGPLPGIAGLDVAYGFSGHGFKLSPIVGRLMAQHALGLPTDLPIAPYALERFSTGKLLHGRYGAGCGFLMRIAWHTFAFEPRGGTMRHRRLIVALAATVAFAGSAAAQERVFFGIATGGTGGTYYPLGGMLAQLISNKVTIGGKKLAATAETAGASVANAQLLARKDIESAFVAADILDAAYSGKGQFEGKPVKNLRALGALYPEQVQLVTLASANVRSFRDLKGKTVSSGSPGSGQWQLLGDLLEAYGMTRKDIGEDLSSFTQSVDKIKDGNLTASLITAGAPTASISELANARDIRIVPLAGPEIEALRKKQPYYAIVTLPANTYKGQAPVDTLAVMAIWATHDGLTDAMAYEVTKALYENTETLGLVHPKGKEISLKTALQSISIPLHPGAEKYYREKGVLK